MNVRLEILTEEKSMQIFLQSLLPRILPEGVELGVNCFVRPHEGKNDLQKRLPKLVRAYKNYPQEVILLVVHDQDANDCKVLKDKLVKLIADNNSDIKHLVRIACRELENWYLGDLAAVENVYPNSRATKQMRRAKFRVPDNLTGTEEMKKFSKDFGKTSCARAIGEVIDIEDNNSVSFGHFLSALQILLNRVKAA